MKKYSVGVGWDMSLIRGEDWGGKQLHTDHGNGREGGGRERYGDADRELDDERPKLTTLDWQP